MSLKIIEQTVQCVDDLIACSELDLRLWKLSPFYESDSVRVISIDKYSQQQDFHGDRAADVLSGIFFQTLKLPLLIMRIGNLWSDSTCEQNGKSVSKGLVLQCCSKRKKSRRAINLILREFRRNVPIIVYAMFGRQRWKRIDNSLSFFWGTHNWSNNFVCELFEKYNGKILKMWKEYSDCTLYIAKCDDLVERAGQLEMIYRCVIALADNSIEDAMQCETESATIAFLIPRHLHERLEEILYKEN